MTLAKPSKICIEPGGQFNKETVLFKSDPCFSSSLKFEFNIPLQASNLSLQQDFVGVQLFSSRTSHTHSTIAKEYTGSVFIEVTPGDRRDCPPFSMALFSLGFVLVISNVLE